MKLKAGNYYTVEEMAELEGSTTKTIYQRIFRAGKKPIGPLYDQEAYNAIKDVPPPGRPPRAKLPKPPAEPEKPPKKARK